MEHPENSAEYKGLTVNSGVAQPSIVNPYLKRGRFRHRSLSAGDYVEGILNGNVTMLGQAVTLVESTNPDHQAVAQEVIEKCRPMREIPCASVQPVCPVRARAQASTLSASMCSTHTAAVLPCWPSTPAVSAARAAFWATRPAWRNSPCIPIVHPSQPVCRLVGRSGAQDP